MGGRAQQKDDEIPLYLSYKDCERIYGISRTTLWRLLRRGEIEGVKVGSAVRLSRLSLDRYMAQHGYVTRKHQR